MSASNFTGRVAAFDRASTAGDLYITQVGLPNTAWWGLEHAAIVQGAAASVDGKSHCVIVEAGAHQGTLALLASKLGCECYAFEAAPKNVLLLERNLLINDVPSKIHVIPGFVGRIGSGRIDAHVRAQQLVTLLKMDIDGMDLAAMHGASKLFNRRAVRFINLEYSPRKQSHAGTGAEYLLHLHEWGFDVFLYSCTPKRAAESKISAALGGGRCLTYGNYGRSLRRGGRGVWPYDEREDARRFVRCLFRLPEPSSATSGLAAAQRVAASVAEVHTEACRAVEAPQLISPSRFEDFAAAVHEVDLVGRLRPE